MQTRLVKLKLSHKLTYLVVAGIYAASCLGLNETMAAALLGFCYLLLALNK
jgi:hypothetical protein